MKRDKILICFFLLSSIQLTSIEAQVRGRWPFDENTGSTGSDISGNQFDAALNNINWTPGVFGSALNFSSPNSSVTFPTSLSGPGFGAKGTIAFWIKGDFSVQNQLTVFDNYRNTDHIFVRTGSNTNQLQIVFQRATGNYAELYMFPISANVWTHLAISWDSLNHMAYIYKDGALVESHAIVNNWFNGSGDPIATAWAPNAQSFALGGGGSSFIGSIDELVLTDVPLSPVEVQQLYANATLNSPDSLAPSIPQEVSSSSTSSTVTRTGWAASTDDGDAGIAGYLIERNGIPVNTVPPTATGFTNFSGLAAGTAYNYAVYAFDYNGNRSPASNTATTITTAVKTAFLSDFESELIDSSALIFPWGQQGSNDNSVTVTREKARAGNKSVKFNFKRSEWSSGNPEWSTGPENLRAEILPDQYGPKNLTVGSAWWIGFSEFIPADWQNDLKENPELIWQFHGATNGPSSGSPPLSAVVIGDSIFIQTRTGTNASVNGEKIINAGKILIPKGVWSDWVINCKFDYTNGFIKVWRNGMQVANYLGPTLYPSLNQTNQNGPYLKLGVYKWFWGSASSIVDERVLFADEVRSGSASAGFADVKPLGAHDSAFIDNTPPVISLTNGDSLEIIQNSTYTENSASAFDAEDGIVPVTISGSVNTAVSGSYTVTYTAKDITGNVAVKTRYVHITDITPPVITLTGIDPMATAYGGTFADPGATAFDESDGSIPVQVTGLVNSNTIGVYTLTYTATDRAGNVATKTRFVLVTDQTAPIVTLSGTALMTIGYGSSFIDPGATAVDNVDGQIPVRLSGAVNTNAIGTYSLVYSATDNAGNTGTKTRTVNVTDQTPPDITLAGAAFITIAHGSVFSDPGATATDAIDGSVTVTKTGTVNTNAIGTYSIVYTSKDAAGNTATKTRTVYVTDQTAPVITISGATPITIAHGSAYTDPGASALDAVDGNVAVTKTGTVNTNTVGSYSVVYSATDNAGNTATKTRIVNVTDQTPPVITLTGSATLTIAHGSTFTDPGATATDAVDGTVTVTKSGTVNSNAVGSYSIVYSARDNAGNTATKTRTVIVSDQTAPVITITGANPTTVAQGSTFTDPGATATDAVDGAVVITKTGMVNTSVIGTYSITYSAKDKVNNTTTATRTVYVKDLTAPVISLIKSTTTKTSATITWNTNESSTSQIVYGLSITYGSSTIVNTTLVTAHSVTIQNLAGCTTYNFAVVSADTANNSASSSNQSFKTACK